jgi:hypothetical protein
VGERTLPLETIWFKYLRRFGMDHWYRFAKQRLHWTFLVDIGTPTKLPKQRGKFPGWETGKVRAKAPCYPTVKKTVFSTQKVFKISYLIFYILNF